MIMEKKNFYRQLRLSCVVLMAAFALNVSAQSSRQVRPYSFNKKGVFYGRQPVMGIDIRTFVDLGYGYAKDRYNVYFEGQILPFVDPMTFRLKVPGSVYQGGYPGDYSDDYPVNPRDGYDPYYNEGYVVTSNAVLYNGRKISASARSFKDLGWGYGKDAFDVYYMGDKVSGASSSSFKVLKDGYAEDTFDTYYRGKVVR